jgi:hypothetical protein
VYQGGAGLMPGHVGGVVPGGGVPGTAARQGGGHLPGQHQPEAGPA